MRTRDEKRLHFSEAPLLPAGRVHFGWHRRRGMSGIAQNSAPRTAGFGFR